MNELQEQINKNGLSLEVREQDDVYYIEINGAETICAFVLALSRREKFKRMFFEDKPWRPRFSTRLLPADNDITMIFIAKKDAFIEG